MSIFLPQSEFSLSNLVLKYDIAFSKGQAIFTPNSVYLYKRLK